MDSSCEKFEAKLLDLLDGEGDAAARREALAHMARCEGCASEFRFYQRLTRSLSDLGAALYARVPEIELRPLPIDQALRYTETPQREDDVLGSDLRALGHELAERMPVIDVRENVMAAVHVMRQQEEANPGLTPELQMDFQAYMEDSLDPAGHARIQAAVDDYPAVRREFEVLCALKEDLVAIGKQYNAAAPRVDLLRADVRDANKPSPILTNTRSARERRRKKSAAPPVISWLGLAAAACLILGLWLTADRWLPDVPDSGSETPVVAVNPEDSAPEIAVPDTAPTQPTPREEIPEVEPVPLPLLLANNVVDTPPPENGEDEPPAFDVSDVLKARRDAAKEEDASTRLALWASLTPDQARKIVHDSGASVEELLGAVKYLETEEARKLLEAAVDEHPENTALRAALADNYAGDASMADASREQLAAWSALDPDNALPLYMEAEILFDQGYAAAALNTLAMAQERDAASAYGLDGLSQHRAALVASGVDPELAGLLAASTAGADQYGDVTSLSQQLLAQGREYEALGDIEAAERIYEAVRQLGIQVETGASFTDERLAGLSAQQQALEAYGQLGTLSSSEIENWLLAIRDLGANITNTLMPLRDAIDSAYQVMDASNVGEFVDFVTNQGDIALGEQILGVTEGLVQSLTSELLHSIFQ